MKVRHHNATPRRRHGKVSSLERQVQKQVAEALNFTAQTLRVTRAQISTETGWSIRTVGKWFSTGEHFSVAKIAKMPKFLAKFERDFCARIQRWEKENRNVSR